jgi:nucleoside-diphosphate-sugar epimerase
VRVFVAGSTGAVGIPTVRALVAAGHEVVGATRSAQKIKTLSELGANGVVADVLDAAAIMSAVAEAKPDAVVQLLTALPERGPMRESHLEATNHLRIEGTRNLLAAAIAAGAHRYVSESIVLGFGASGETPLTEDAPFARVTPGYPFAPALGALASLDSQVLGSNEIEGIVLRFGIYYGPTAGSTTSMVRMARRRMLALPKGGGLVSWIHLDDAASAVVAALERGRGGQAYNIVDGTPASMGDLAAAIAAAVGTKGRRMPMFLARLGAPYITAALTLKLRVANEKARRELGWTPRYPSYRAGLRATLQTHP